MSYNHESDPQDERQQNGADPTEAYQATSEWDAVSQPESWEQGEQPDNWDPTDEEHWDDEREGSAAGVTAAKQTISVAADKITRWFSGLDRRPEYEDQYQGADPVATVTPGSERVERAPGFASRERGASASAPTGRRAAASRAIAANRRRSIAATRDGASGGPAFSRGSAHAARALRGGERDRPLAPSAASEERAEPLPELMGGDGSARFPVAPLGYNRQAVDQQFAELEGEMTQLREALAQQSHHEPPMSIQEELERIGEETASILVVAHDKANETTRMAQEQAERCISDAAANAVSITEEAKRKLRELEAETDGVRRRRERLIADARKISGSLGALADEAEQRFAPEPLPNAEPEMPAAQPVLPAERPLQRQAEPTMHGPSSAA
jgi:cell division septum initiation protein DivIVA